MLIGFGIRAGAFDEDFKGRGMETGTSTYIYTHAHTYIRMQEAGKKLPTNDFLSKVNIQICRLRPSGQWGEGQHAKGRKGGDKRDEGGD